MYVYVYVKHNFNKYIYYIELILINIPATCFFYKYDEAHFGKIISMS